MNLKKNIMASMAGLMLLANACTVTQKMGQNGVPVIKTPDSKDIHKAMMITNKDGLHFSQDRNGRVFSQPIPLSKDYTLCFEHDQQEHQTYALAYNPEVNKKGQAQIHAIIKIEDTHAKPDDLKHITEAAETWKPNPYLLDTKLMH
jgi:hypothetical protein